MTKQEVIKEFTKLKGVGTAKAELLYSQGFTSLEQLSHASINELSKIKGITGKNAEEILAQVTKTKKVTPKSTKKETKKSKEQQTEDVEIVEETEEVYKVKKKPQLDKRIQEKLHMRKQIKKRRPEFIREEWFRYKRVGKNWRKPDGITSKMRINLKYRPSKVRIGFRGPKEVRGFHASGFEEVLINNVMDLDKIDPKTQAARIGKTVGTKKRLEIAKKAEEKEIRILNMKV